MHLAVETDRLRRVYTTRAANGRRSTLVVLDDVTLSVRRGELFGVLGVNGAGKSTLLQILGAQLRPTSGTAKVAGFDVCRYASYVRRYVGVVCVDDGPILRLRAPELSSGQRQRAHLERGFASSPQVCCSISLRSGSTARPRGRCGHSSAGGCVRTPRAR